MKLRYEGQGVYFDAKGYACVWRDGKNKKVHVLEWEKHHGPKPEGFEIHHIDEDKANFAVGNLALLTSSDHQRVHAGWVREDGAWVEKPCTSCLKILPLSDFYQRKGYTPSARCKPCHIAATRQWALKNPEKRKAIGLASYHRSKLNA